MAGYKNYYSKGFSLIEISIVLVIISLLIVGVTAGSSLIHQATLRNIITEQSNYIKTIYLFKNKYGGFPGDWPNSSKVWGTSCSSTPTDCDGNGDGIIENDWSSTYNDESLRAWQILGLAGMVNHQYLGIGPFQNTYYNTSGSRAPLVPTAPMGANWMIVWNGPYDPTYKTGQIITGQALLFGVGGYSAISPADAYYIDSKMDDGYPLDGLILAQSGAPGNCFNNTYTLTAPYNLNISGARCILYFVFNPTVQ